MATNSISTTLDTKRWQAALQWVHRAVESGQFPAVSLCAGVADRIERRHAEGRFDAMNPADPATVAPETPFLVASLTKPITVMAVLMLVERGLVRINDRGPFIKGRVIDLTMIPARQIEMISDGIVPVKIEVLKPIEVIRKPNRTLEGLQ